MNGREMAEKITNRLVVLKVSSNLIDECYKYLNGDTHDKKFISRLPGIELNRISYQEMNYIRDDYRVIKDCGDSGFIERYFDIMLAIGKTTIFDVLSPVIGHFAETTLYDMPECRQAKIYFLSWCAEEVVKGSFSMRVYINKLLNKIYKEDKEFFEEAVKLCSVNAQLFLAAFLVNRDAGKYKELKKWLENVTQNSFTVLFQKDKSDEVIELAVKYVNGGLFVSDGLVDKIASKLDVRLVNNYIRELLIGMACIIYTHSNIMKRFIKMMILISYHDAFNAIHAAVKSDAHDENNKLIPFDISYIIKDLNIPGECYIAWMGNRSAQTEGEFDAEIRKEIKSDTDIVKKAAELADDFGSAYLNRLLLESEPDGERVRLIEDSLIETFEKFFKELNIAKSVYDPYLPYLRGQKDFDGIKENVIKVIGRQTIYFYQYREFFKKISWAKNISPIFKRSLCFFFYGGQYDSVREITKLSYNNRDRAALDSFIEEIKSCGVAADGIIPFVAEYASGQHYGFLEKPSEEYMKELIRQDAGLVAGSIANCNAEARAYLLEQLYCFDKDKFAPVLTEYTNDSSKTVRDKIVGLLGGGSGNRGLIMPLLSDKKQAVRECAVHILSIWNDEASRKALEEALDNEKSDKIRNVIANILKLSPGTDPGGDINIIDYCRNALKKNRGGAVSWIDFDSLPGVRYKDGDETADPDIVRYLVISYSLSNVIAMNHEAKKISKYLNEKDVEDLVLEILNRWIEGGAESKRKWVLPLAAIHGDDRTVMLLKKKIQEWSEHSRGAIACEAVTALALNGSSMALMLIDNISRKFKFRQVKEAAAAAFDFAAGELGVDPEELSDRIVPDLGFDKRGERVFDYGTRKFTVRLNPALELEIFDENDKKIKVLPAPRKNDQAELAKNAAEEFKLLKKQLKSTADIQAVRLETVLAANRVWNAESWNKLFVDNPIMQQFATSLIWGSYIDGRLQCTFRYMEDGSFNTKDEEEYEVPEEACIGLVHPVELPEDEIEQWKTQLEDYEVKQPFEQVLRKTYKAGEENIENSRVERFGGIKVNGLSLLGKLTKFGWYRGSVRDGGCYTEFYKENVRLGIGAELSFSGVGVGYENEEVTIYDVVFYKAGTVRRGSYVYDSVKDSGLLRPDEVPERFFSEILYDIERSTASKTGADENWKKDRR